jgi:hypothetical protein
VSIDLDRSILSIEDIFSAVEQIAKSAPFRNALLRKASAELAVIAVLPASALEPEREWRRIVGSLRSRAQLAVARHEERPDDEAGRELADMRDRIERATRVARAALREYFLLQDSQTPLDGLLADPAGHRGGE